MAWDEAIGCLETTYGENRGNCTSCHIELSLKKVSLYLSHCNKLRPEGFSMMTKINLLNGSSLNYNEQLINA